MILGLLMRRYNDKGQRMLPGSQIVLGNARNMTQDEYLARAEPTPPLRPWGSSESSTGQSDVRHRG